ncbi:hypothetical protein PROFUN_08830 [Planoprotostelium fungivorum]|uniref:Uncharacterized protein n=1 Tax=Planoprotostelium fungivorum TaxID=1890364 RepID=A0A2P6NIV2_9EUKA|nr:hypothetical protein PROFUN_08830 [Planoprotostelium fungivorum]
MSNTIAVSKSYPFVTSSGSPRSYPIVYLSNTSDAQILFAALLVRPSQVEVEGDLPWHLLAAIESPWKLNSRNEEIAYTKPQNPYGMSFLRVFITKRGFRRRKQRFRGSIFHRFIECIYQYLSVSPHPPYHH